MDVAKTLGIMKERSPAEWLRSANRYGPPALSAILVLAIAYQLALLTWAVAPNDIFDLPPPAVGEPLSTGESSGPALDLSALASSHLFGEPPKQAPAVPVETVVEAPDTTLSIRLTGVVAGTDGETGQAIIASGRDQEKKYAVGQSIDGGSGATLHAVYSDRVILNRNGQLETLRLPKDLAAAGGAASGRVAAPRTAPAPAVEDASIREVISDNVSRLTNVMRMAPQIEGGQMIGFRVNPGRDRETFEALGLQPGDVVTDINGMMLDDASRGLQAFEALGESTMANVTILRDGASTVLVIDTTQLQDLAENRQ